MMKKLIFPSIFLIILVFMACQEKMENDPSNIFADVDQSGCEGCHLDKALLAEIAEPIESGGESSGEG
jgi:hypothetical protein